MLPPFAIAATPHAAADPTSIPSAGGHPSVEGAWRAALPALTWLLEACTSNGRADDAALLAAVIQRFEGGPSGGGEPVLVLSESAGEVAGEALTVVVGSGGGGSSPARTRHGRRSRAAATNGASVASVCKLSVAEHRVCRGIASGLSNKAIASELCVSRRTVEGHVARALRKLGLSSRVQIAMLMGAAAGGSVLAPPPLARRAS